MNKLNLAGCFSCSGKFLPGPVYYSESDIRVFAALQQTEPDWSLFPAVASSHQFLLTSATI